MGYSEWQEEQNRPTLGAYCSSHPWQSSSLSSEAFQMFLVISHSSPCKGAKEIPTLVFAVILLQHTSL